MGRKKATAAKTAAPKTTRTTRSSKNEENSDEDDDWSTSVITSRPAKKLHYSLDALLEEKQNAPPPDAKKDEEMEDEPEAEDEMIDNDEALDALTEVGYKKTDELKELLHFEDQVKQLDRSLLIWSKPVKTPSLLSSLLSTLPTEPSPKKSSTPPRRMPPHECALRALCDLINPEGREEDDEMEQKGDEDNKSETDSDDFEIGNSPAMVAADGISLITLLQPVINYIQADHKLNTKETELCSGILSWLLLLVAHHKQKTISGSVFSLISTLLNSTFLPGSSYVLPPNISLLPPTPSAVFWASLLTPNHFFSIWDNYGFEFIGKGVNVNPDETSTSTTSSSLPSAPSSSSPSTSPSSTSSSPNLPTNSEKEHPNKFNLMLVLHIIQKAIEISPSSFSPDSLHTILHQSLQLMLDPKTISSPLATLFSTTLLTLLELPLNQSSTPVYTSEQQTLISSLCDDFLTMSTDHRIWKRIADSIPLSSPPSCLLRTLFACNALQRLALSHLSPSPPSSSSIHNLPTLMTSKTPAQDLMKWLCTVIEGEYTDDSVLLSVVELLGLCVGPYIGYFKSSIEEVNALKQALKNMNMHVKEAGYHTLVKTKVKDLLILQMGYLGMTGGNKS